MNQKLQNILDIIQQSEKLDAEQKNNLIKAVKDADKELEITAFKLERTEKVKKTTAILLEETIEELEQKRKAVEIQNRELEIESSLERVRTQAMSMMKPDDLLGVSKIIFDEMYTLGFHDLRNSLINIFNDEEKFFLNYDYSDDLDGSISKVLYDSHPIVKEFVAQIRRSSNAFVETVIEENQLNDWKEFRKSHGEKDDQRLENIDALYYYTYSISHGSIGISTFKPISEEQLGILKRFRNVFDLSYQRYVDITLAERQAREAQIEAALERIRAAMMAMHKSDELRTVVASLFKQLQSLGFEAAGCNVIVYHDDRSAEHWMTGYAHDVYPESYKIPYVDHPYFTDLLEAWQNEVAFEEFIFEGKMKTEYGDWLLKNSDFKNLPEEFIKEMTSPELHVISDAFNRYGMLEIMGTEPLQENKIEILQRFSKVFEQTYTRFLDLQKAEAQAREAQIEASLERVRAVSMAMHKPEDLLNVSKIQFKEFKKLGFSDIRNALIAIFNDDEEYFLDHDYSDDTGGNINKVLYNSHPVIDKLLTQSRKANDAFVELVIDKDQLDRWKEFRRSHGEKDDPRLSNIDALYYYNYSIGFGVVGFSTTKPIGEEYLKVLKRFRNVFDLAYRRYIDIAQAEAQAREAQIEASLEKVRAVAMSMNKSEDLLSICEVSFKEFKKLGFDKIRNALIHIQYDEQKYFMDYDFSDLTGGAITKLEYGSHPVVEDYLQQIRSAKDAFYQGVIKEDQLEEWKDFRRNSGQIDDPRLDKATALYYYFFSIGIGDIGISTLQPINEYQIKILNRFRNVFDLAYRRYTDITKAEAQAKEANKQASLDRVRGEIASMRTSEDLNRITPIIWRELKNLEVPFFRCGVFIVDEAQQRTQVYLTTPDGKSLGVLNLQFGSNELADNIIEQWKKKQVYTEHWDKEKFIRWTKSMMKLGQIQNPETYQGSANPPESLDLHFVPFAQGMLYVGDVSPLTEEKLQLVKTLGEAFSIAYARYEDFKHLEEAKNKIELTLTELKSAQAQLVHSEKMASLGELTAGIAHEIKNPLNFVNNFSEVSRDLLDEMKIELEKNNIQEVIEIVTDLKQNLEKINLHGKRADSIVKGMLLHSRGSAGEKTLTDINELLDQYVNLAYHGMRAQNKEFNITIEKDYDNSLGKVNVIPQEISRVFLNIINNACYAAFDRKKQGDNNFNPVLNVSTKNHKNKVEIRIGDNGNGIPANLIDKIFQPFFTTKPSGEGTGLGLSLSYDIVKAHGGELKVKTTGGEGTVFTIDLPIEN